MASVNFTVPEGQYDAMMTVLNGIRSKLAANKVVLTRILSQEDGQAKIRAFALTDEGKWLRKIKKANDEVNVFFASVGWRE